MTTPIEVAALALEAILWEPDATEETRARAVFQSIDRDELADVIDDSLDMPLSSRLVLADAIISHLTGGQS